MVRAYVTNRAPRERIRNLSSSNANGSVDVLFLSVARGGKNAGSVACVVKSVLPCSVEGMRMKNAKRNQKLIIFFHRNLESLV